MGTLEGEHPPAPEIPLRSGNNALIEWIHGSTPPSVPLRKITSGSRGVPRAGDGESMIENIPYRVEPGTPDDIKKANLLDLYSPENVKNFPTIVWFHGGGLTEGSRLIPEKLKNLGFAVATIGYRLSPSAKSPAYVEDAAAAVAWVFKNIENYGGAPDKIFVSGHSAGAYLTLMLALDKQYLAAHGFDANRIAGIIPLSGHAITHCTIRSERGMSETQPLIDEMAPLFHIRANTPPILLVTGDREQELLGRYEENAYLWRMMKISGNQATDIHELKGFDHGAMVEPGLDLLVKFVREQIWVSESGN